MKLKQIEKYIVNKRILFKKSLILWLKNQQSKKALLVFLTLFILIGARGSIFLANAQANPRGSVNQCSLGAVGFTNADVDYAFSPEANTPINLDQVFQIGMRVKFKDSQVAGYCTGKLKFEYEMKISLYDNYFNLASWQHGNSTRISTDAMPITDSSGTVVGFSNKLPVGSVGQLFKSTNSGTDLKNALSSGDNYYAYFYLKMYEPGNPSNFINIPLGDNYAFWRELSLTAPVGTPGQVSDDFSPNNSTSTTVSSDGVKLISDLGVTFTPQNDQGLRSKYRVLKSDSSLSFGQAKGPDSIYAKWKDDSYALKVGDEFELPNKDDGWIPQFNPKFQGIHFAINYASRAKEYAQCDAGRILSDCSGNVFYNDDRGSLSSNFPGLPQGGINPVIKSTAWNSTAESKTAGLPQGAISSTEFVVLPIVAGGKDLDYIFDVGVRVMLGKTPPKFTVEVFETLDAIKEACKADLQAAGRDTAKCEDEQFAKYGFSDLTTQSTSSTEQGQQSVASTLYGFLAKVISYLVLLMTSTLYYIFSLIVAPFLTAILHVSPWKDSFVNFIYPGWIIMRNLSNIFFIAALLYMGLRILFQQEDSSKTRGFIIRLILAALLVNFSLVIGQGIVAIADTVQSQFLPADNKVIEALGAKLMVDPVLVFRDGVGATSGSTSENIVTGLTSSGNNFDADVTASDIPKAIVLWILSVSAFFAFVALAAFASIRVVALWLLYLVSPIAYVGYILPMTQKAANQWWSNFIKYATTVPILAFFLNISALLAVAMSNRVGQTVDTSSAYEVLGIKQYVAGELTSFVFTTASHFIVLLFLFGGMIFASQSGTYGSKEIVNWAKRKAKQVAALPYKAAKFGAVTGKDMAADALITKYKNNDRAKSLISVLAKPGDAAKSAWSNYFTKPREDMQKRIQAGRGHFDNYFDKIGQNKVHHAKTLGWKMVGRTAEDVENNAGEFGKLLTDKERQEKSSKKLDLEKIKKEFQSLKSGQDISLADLDYYSDKLESKIKTTKQAKESDQQLKDLRKAEGKAVARGDNKTAASLKAEYLAREKGFDDQIDDLQNKHDGIVNNTDLKEAKRLGKDEVSIDSFDPDILKDINTFGVDNAQLEINNLNADIESDNKLRSALGISQDDPTKLITNFDEGHWTEEDRQRIAESTAQIVKDKSFPESMRDKNKKAEKIKDEREKINNIDDSQMLMRMYDKAQKENNTILAGEITKKLAELGDFPDLLTQKSFFNNITDLRKFINQDFANLTQAERNLLASQISAISKKNGNLGLGDATYVNENQQIFWNTDSVHNEKLRKSAGKKKLWDKKPNEIFGTDSGGKKILLPGQLEEINKLDKNNDVLKTVRSRTGTKVASDLVSMHSSGQIVLEKNVLDALRVASGK
ncbi:MAG: hypothetical protein R3B41_00555 [Candidatus Doudnabacteria bacterium]